MPWLRVQLPGLDQFDFYQPIKHSVLMVEKDGPAQAKYEDIINCEHKNDKIVLTRSGGVTASFPDDGSWLMFDCTPTCGWNENPGVIPEISGMRQVKIQLLRRRDSEDSTWADDLYLFMDTARFCAGGKSHWEDPVTVKDELLKVVQNWLQTKQCWKANVVSRCDFNWGDLVNELPIEVQGVTLADVSNERMALNAEVTIAVDQDELLAPNTVPATLIWEDGTQAVDCIVDFQVGGVYHADPNQKIPRHETEERLRIISSAETTFLVHWDVFDKLYYLALEQNK